MSLSHNFRSLSNSCTKGSETLQNCYRRHRKDTIKERPDETFRTSFRVTPAAEMPASPSKWFAADLAPNFGGGSV
jgi:hypothetical protein